MKNKRNVIIAFILICCLCLSIGYAALTDTLIINGSASAAAKEDTPDEPVDTLEEAFDDKLGFTAVVQATGNSANVSLKNGDAAVSTTQTTFTMTDEVTFSAAGFAQKGDKAVITYTITNNHPDLSASIAVPTLTDASGNTLSNEYFSVSHDWTTAHNVAAVNGTTTVTVTVEMIKTPIENKEVSFKLTFTASAVESSSSGT